MEPLKVNFFRHGIAVDRSPDRKEFERELTPKGRDRTAQIARWLYDRGDRWDALLSSPLLRAKQTAQILVEAQLAADVERFEALAPGGEFSDLAAWGRSHAETTAIGVVGHQPNLSNWIELAVWGQASGSIQLKKAGLACVEFPGGRIRLGAGVLLELLTPKSMLGTQLRARDR
ncbi:phosphohistidine phosphatase SixA [Synechococcus sp. PCC 7336]|uniref:phosphohistidine phosphatase SixA n=1 Tax=Synechococcus sp. PCC 7336 TaxID=195250 RepID=UPI00034CB44E|nr:phosphohistidine phosphatase SixA [Synechococcus sp. PCC 7336]